MRKSTKLAILVAALVALCSLTAFAADTWKQEGDDWYCYDSDGNLVYGEARKSGANYYYLDSTTGAMVKNTLIDNGAGDRRYYGADGARVLGQWVKVAVEDNNDGDGWEWMYFKPVTGIAYDDSAMHTINSKKYYFDGNGYAATGYVDSSYQLVDYASEAEYYFGDKEDASAQTCWVNILDGADTNFESDASVWFYFKSGQKIRTTVKVNGQRYYFNNTYGDMYTGWNQTDSIVTSETPWLYFGDANDGKLKKSQWIQTYKFTGDEDDSRWYYLTSDGTRQDGGVAKISGKFYLFNDSDDDAEDKAMVSGLVYGTATDTTTPKNFSYEGSISYKKELTSNTTIPETKVIMYFSADDTDGSMKTGAQTVTLDGEEVSMMFDSHGYAYEGYVGKKIYKNGILQSAGSDKVAVVFLRVGYDSTIDAGYYLVNSSGSLLKNTKAKDADGYYWATRNDYDEIAKFADQDYAADAASAWLKGYTTFDKGSGSSKVTYELVEVTGTYTGYKYFKYQKQ